MTSALAELTGHPYEFAHAWPDEPRLYRARMDLGRLFNSGAAREVVSSGCHRPIQMAMVRDGRLTGEACDPDHRHSTIGLNGLHHTWQPIAVFAKRLAAELGHPITGNAYRTPPGARGYDPHWDTHHVFLAQSEGVKHWNLCQPVFEHPTEVHGWKKVGFTEEQQRRFREEEPDMRMELTEGHVLFIPRGWVHWGGTTGDVHSLHVTLGVHLLNRLWLLRQVVDQLLEQPSFREALPPNLGDRNFGGLVEETWASAQDWLAGSDTDSLGFQVWLVQQAEMLTRK